MRTTTLSLHPSGVFLHNMALGQFINVENNIID